MTGAGSRRPAARSAATIVLSVAVFFLVATAVGSTAAVGIDAVEPEPTTDQLPGSTADQLSDSTRDQLPESTLDGTSDDVRYATQRVHPHHGDSDAAERQPRPVASVQSTATTNVELEQTLQLTPERPGTYDAHNVYRLPASLSSLEVHVPDGVRVVGSRGFAETDEGRWSWDQTTDRPSMRFRVQANRTVDRDDPIAGPGDYMFVDVGDWAIVQRPALSHSWGWTGTDRVGFDRQLRADPGVAGDVMAYLGPYEAHERTASGQTFTLVEPERADLAHDPEVVLDELAYGADALRVGDRDDSVFAVAAPTADVQWGVRGLQTGPSDMWVRDFEPLDEPGNVWLHEYVHTRQDWRTAPSARWITEATATYYAALLTLEQGGIDFDQFARRLERGEAQVYADVALSDPDTWHQNAEYNLGALVVGEVDRQLRLATDGERSFQDVFRAVNREEGEVDSAVGRSAVARHGGEVVAGDYHALVEGETRARMWSSGAHEDAFGTLPARIGYRLTDDDALRVSSQYRDRPVGNDRTFVPGERLTADVLVENAGETAGDFEATMRLDGQPIDGSTGRLESGESATVTLGGTVTERGQGTLRVGDGIYPIDVRDPARASVTDVDVARTDVRVGEPVDVSVTLQNDAGWPAERDLVLVADGRQLDSTTVHLDAEETQTITRTVRFRSAGTYRVTVRDADAYSEPVVVSRGWRSPGTLLGVGLVAVVLAIVAATFRRRRS